MKEKENQTPRKEQSRTSDLGNRRFKDSPVKKTLKKVSQKSLTEAFTSSVKDVSLEISEDSINFSSLSGTKLYNETAESIVMASYQPLSTPTETLTPSELTPTSLISTTIRDEQNKFSNSGSAEVEIVVNLLNQARVQALASSDMENVSKRILDALIKSIINEFYTLLKRELSYIRLLLKMLMSDFSAACL